MSDCPRPCQSTCVCVGGVCVVSVWVASVAWVVCVGGEWGVGGECGVGGVWVVSVVWVVCVTGSLKEVSNNQATHNLASVVRGWRLTCHKEVE